jgi:hypothetical protein
MELNLKERIILLNILPKQGDISTIKIVRDLQDNLAPTEAEFKDFEITQEGSQYFWNEKGKIPKEIEIGAKAKQIIRDAILALDKAKALTQDHLTIYDKFVEDKDANN